MAVAKTNALRILDGKKIAYSIYTYDSSDGKIDGISVAQKIGKDEACVYKTLVAEGSSRAVYVFIIPVAAELDQKKAAQVTQEKKVDLVPVKDILSYTGYIRGGCSPIGMKKKYRTFLDSSANDILNIVVSAGKIGVQMELATASLISAAEAEIAVVVK